MRKTSWRLGLGMILLAWSGWMLFSDTSSGTMGLQKKAKEATNNDRGKWLVAEKEKRNAKEVDVNWLKDYPGDKK